MLPGMRTGTIRPKSLRRLRVAAAVALAGSVLLIATTAHNKAVGWLLPNGWHAGVLNGTLSLGYELPASRGAGTGPYVTWYNSNAFPLAWRPYHAVHRIYLSNRTHTVRSIVTPLWPVPLCAAALLGWAQGGLTGLRAARSRSCLACGYDLSPMLATQEHVRCPECGAARSHALAGRA